MNLQICIERGWHLNKVIPQLSAITTELFHAPLVLDRKDMLKIFVNGVMKEMKRGSIMGGNIIIKTMKVVPGRNKINKVLKEVEENYSPHKLALLKIC